MPSPKSKSKSMGTPGVKMLITAASLAATLGGWALLSADEAQSVPQQPALPTTSPTTSQSAPQVAPQGTASTLVINLAPLPTLVPLISYSHLVTTGNTTAGNTSVSRPIVQPAAPVQRAAPAPLALRVVSAPVQQSARPSTSAPAPVVSTHSSR